MKLHRRAEKRDNETYNNLFVSASPPVVQWGVISGWQQRRRRRWWSGRNGSQFQPVNLSRAGCTNVNKFHNKLRVGWVSSCCVPAAAIDLIPACTHALSHLSLWQSVLWKNLKQSAFRQLGTAFRKLYYILNILQLNYLLQLHLIYHNSKQIW